MNKFLFLSMLGVLSLAVACGNTPTNTTSDQSTKITNATTTNDVIVMYFHGKQRCITCNAIEKLTKEVVEGLKNEQVVIKVVDISKPENEALADKYEVSWSSLILDKGGKVNNLTDMGFSYAKGQPELFKAELTKAIKEMLK